MERFIRQQGGVIVDNQTGLEWFVGPDRNTTWSEARSWALKQRVDGGNWRLPTIKELETLYIKGSGKGNLPEEFTKAEWYVWSSEPNDLHTAWAYFFPLGGEEWSTRAASHNFRAFAVRSKQDVAEAKKSSKEKKKAKK